MDAASNNPVHPTSYRVGQSEGIRLVSMPNGNQWTILAHMAGTNGWTGNHERNIWPVLQFDVDVVRGRLHAHFDKYGPDRYWTLDELDAAIAAAAQHILNWRLVEEPVA